jgi:hypothetical protein
VNSGLPGANRSGPPIVLARRLSLVANAAENLRRGPMFPGGEEKRDRVFAATGGTGLAGLP